MNDSRTSDRVIHAPTGTSSRDSNATSGQTRSAFSLLLRSIENLPGPARIGCRERFVAQPIVQIGEKEQPERAIPHRELA